MEVVHKIDKLSDSIFKYKRSDIFLDIDWYHPDLVFECSFGTLDCLRASILLNDTTDIPEEMFTNATVSLLSIAILPRDGSLFSKGINPKAVTAMLNLAMVNYDETNAWCDTISENLKHFGFERYACQIMLRRFVSGRQLNLVGDNTP